MSRIREEIIKLVDSRIPEGSFSGTVTKLDGSVCSVQPTDGGAVYHKVKLKPAVDGKDFGVIIQPKIGSAVIVSPLGRQSDGFYVNQWSEVEQVSIKTSKGVQILFNSNGTLELNGNNFGGIVKINRLVSRLNNIENALNTFITIFNAHTNDGKPLTSPPAVTTTLTTLAQLNNPKVKHGG